MAMHLEVFGGRFVAAMAVLLAVAGNAAFAQEHKTYRCKVARKHRIPHHSALDIIAMQYGHPRSNALVKARHPICSHRHPP